MDKRFLTVLGVSLVFALLVSSIFYQMTAKAGPSRPSGPTDVKDVVVATRPLGIGITIKPGDVKIVKISADAFPKGAFSKDTDVLDRAVISNVLADEPVLDGRLAVRGAGVGVSSIVPVGMRAVSVRVNDVSSVTGFVLPGMRVDVLVTGRMVNRSGGGGDTTLTRTCLQNMLILSSGQQIQPDAKGSAINASTVTILATPEEAELLTLANSEGHIQLVLRNGGDQTIEKTRGKVVQDLFGVGNGRSRQMVAQSSQASDGYGDSEPAPRPRVRRAQPANDQPPAMAPTPAPPPPPDQVIMIRGNQKTVEVVNRAR